MDGAAFSCGARQIDFEDGARPRFTVNPNEAFVLLNNAIHSRQSEPRPFSRRLGGVERFKNVWQVFPRDPRAIVGYGDQSIAAFGNGGWLTLNVVFVKLHVRSFDADMASV